SCNFAHGIPCTPLSQLADQLSLSWPLYYILSHRIILTRRVRIVRSGQDYPPRRCYLLNNLGDGASTYRAATFANREPKSLLDRDRRDQLNTHLDVVAWHHHLHTFRQLNDAGHVRGANVELRAVAR